MKNNLYPEEQLEKDLEVLREMHDRVSKIVWMPQEQQEEHFDKLCKSEQIAILGIFGSIKNSIEHLQAYKDWFKNDRRL